MKWTRQPDGSWERQGGGDRTLWAFHMGREAGFWRGGVRYGPGGQERHIYDRSKLHVLKAELNAWEVQMEKLIEGEREPA